MNSTGLISVIVPVYNAENKIKACIRSILSQSFSDFFLILVNDGSTDSSGKICEYYQRIDNRVFTIHQKNKGSIEARKSGIYSSVAKKSKYLCLCDADDIMPEKALEILVSNAEKYQADCVCGNAQKIFKGFIIPRKFTRFVPECFSISEPRIYDHSDIMRELYVSCFGISNYPVSLWAKLYRRELLSDAAGTPPIVEFMGDDLSVTLRIMPKIERLVIIPDTVYYYRMGGGTSKFMPHMMDDFIELYRWKDKLRKQYEMEKGVKTLIDIELMNTVVSFLDMCKCKGQFDEEELRRETSRVIDIPEIKEAAKSLSNTGKSHFVAKWIKDRDLESLINYVENHYEKTKIKRTVRKLVKL